MKLDAKCYGCLVGRSVHMAEQQPKDERRGAFIRDCLRVLLEEPREVTSPYLLSRFNREYTKYYEIADQYEEQKKFSNRFAMKRSPQVKAVLETAADPVETALKFARMGNYIDFGALGDAVNEKDFNILMDQAVNDTIEPVEYTRFIQDLRTAKKLLYITDNAGEIVMDKLLIEEIQHRFPDLSICVAVRGAPVLNDATMEDAVEIGLDKIVRVIDNGNDVGGTYIPELSEEMRHELETADVILAKGQGNFETMLGCGLNVYYVFLCKCQFFVELFGVEQMTGMFINERRIKMP